MEKHQNSEKDPWIIFIFSIKFVKFNNPLKNQNTTLASNCAAEPKYTNTYVDINECSIKYVKSEMQMSIYS